MYLSGKGFLLKYLSCLPLGLLESNMCCSCSNCVGRFMSTYFTMAAYYNNKFITFTIRHCC